MRSKHLSLYTIIITTVLLLAMSFTASAASVARMSTDELNAKLGDTDLVVLDVRGSWDLVKSDNKIAGSERVQPGGAKGWAKNYAKDKTIVLYCA